MKNLKNHKINKRLSIFGWVIHCLFFWIMILSISDLEIPGGITLEIFLYIFMIFGFLSLWKEMNREYFQYLYKLKDENLLIIKKSLEDIEYSEKELKKISEILDKRNE